MNNKTYITFKEHSALNKTIIRLRSLPLIIIYMAAIIVFTAYGIWVKNWIIGGVGISICVIFPLITFLYLNKKIKDTYKQSKEIYDKIHYEFTFNEDSVECVLIQDNTKNSITKKYEELNSVIETKDFIFIFIDNKRAYIVDINGFDNFDRVEFRSIVQTKTKKYKILGR
ncbi:MAG: YcxB family protein [Bacilli bacterium]|nr:YcxB family protein [Bacilli bacterium]